MKPDSILYYPHIEFQNVAWVKSSLLLWNHVYRIVPEGYVPNDNDDIKALIDEVIDTLRQQGGYATWGNLYQIMDFSIKK